MSSTLRVWDPLVRIAHWLLVLSVLGAWLTQSGWGRWHEWIGYASLAVVAVRLFWGWRGAPYARFTQFVRSPGATLVYARQAVRGREPRHVGHNPLGGWMILALLLLVSLVGFTGWLYTTDRFWGIEWVETLHSRLVDLLLVLIGLHLLGVLVASLRHHENLVGAMIHGRKRAADD